jgi:hypothetical protein
MKIIPTQLVKTAEIYKENKVFAIRLFEHGQYIETFYCRLKRDIKPHLKKLDYKITYDFSLLKTVN